MLRTLVHRVGRWYIGKILSSEAAGQKPRAINERPAELSFLFECLRETAPLRVLDVGPGQSPLPALLRNCGCQVMAIDNVSDYWSAGMINRHWMVVDEDIRNPHSLPNDFDLVNCISVIEHIDDHVSAFRSMMERLRPGGHLVVTCPYNETRYVEDVYKLPGGDQGQPQGYICASFNRDTIKQWLAAAPGTEIVRQQYWRIWSGDVWSQGSRLRPENACVTEPHHLTGILFRKSSGKQ